MQFSFPYPGILKSLSAKLYVKFLEKRYGETESNSRSYERTELLRFVSRPARVTCRRMWDVSSSHDGREQNVLSLQYRSSRPANEVSRFLRETMRDQGPCSCYVLLLVPQVRLGDESLDVPVDTHTEQTARTRHLWPSTWSFDWRNFSSYKHTKAQGALCPSD